MAVLRSRRKARLNQGLLFSMITDDFPRACRKSSSIMSAERREAQEAGRTPFSHRRETLRLPQGQSECGGLVLHADAVAGRSRRTEWPLRLSSMLTRRVSRYVPSWPNTVRRCSPARGNWPICSPTCCLTRRGSRGCLAPEIDLAGPPADPGISHLHAVLIAQQDGTWLLLDHGSSNGTQLNGRQIASGVPVKLRDGDRISLGAWTLLTVRSG